MRSYSLLSILFLSLASYVLCFFLILSFLILSLEKAVTNFFYNQCLASECPEKILFALQEPRYLRTVVVNTITQYLPWFLLFLIVFVALTYYLYKEISLPLQEIQNRAVKFSRGIFHSGIPDYKLKELSRFAHTMNNLATKLKGLELMRKDFVANVSHELKTPITSIKGFVETIIEARHDTDPQETQRFLEIVKQQADRMNSVIEDLILISKLESDNAAINIHKEPRFLVDLLQTVKNQFQLKAKEKAIAININCSENLLVSCSQVLLEQALSNMIDNAVKYCAEESKIEVRATDGSGIITLTIKDNGPGISANHLPRIFERFYRVDKTRNRSNGGSGLGLSITKHIITAHGGKIQVKSKKGQGTEFTIELPKAA